MFCLLFKSTNKYYYISCPEKMIRLVAYLLLVATTALAAPAEDLITNLPGLDFAINFNQYSGYLNGTPGRHLHYWFVESQNDPANDPLFLWLNGGPGCSSLMGFLTELGPFRVADDGVTLLDFPYSWNKIANIVFLESPACVGFAYDDLNNCATGDDEVAEMNYLALQEFFTKFPEFQSNDFYITGESYGGIYVPTLAVKVVDGQTDFPINFVGYAIGNGLLSYDNNDNSLIFYAYYHALIGQTHWNNLVSRCCVDGIESEQNCDFANPSSVECRESVLHANQIIYYSGINHYNLYGDCKTAPSGKTSRTEYTAAWENVFRKVRDPKYTRPEPYSDPPCLDNSGPRNYLNQPEVRAALHIPDGVQAWDVCSDPVGASYNRQYNATTPQLLYLQSFVKGLVYNGDTDLACNFLGNEWDLETLGLTLLGPRKKWTADNDVAGYYIQYPNIDFVTVRGSGHMVPEYRPIQGLQMITSFVNGTPY